MLNSQYLHKKPAVSRSTTPYPSRKGSHSPKLNIRALVKSSQWRAEEFSHTSISVDSPLTYISMISRQRLRRKRGSTNARKHRMHVVSTDIIVWSALQAVWIWYRDWCPTHECPTAIYQKSARPVTSDSRITPQPQTKSYHPTHSRSPHKYLVISTDHFHRSEHTIDL